MKILLAEDNDGHAELISIYLQDGGIETDLIRFKTGKSIIDFFAETNWQLNEKYLLLLDIKMPIMDGIEVLEEFNRQNFIHQIPVIVITTSINPDDMKACFKLGCKKFIQKGTESDLIVEYINEFMP